MQKGKNHCYLVDRELNFGVSKFSINPIFIPLPSASNFGTAFSTELNSFFCYPFPFLTIHNHSSLWHFNQLALNTPPPCTRWSLTPFCKLHQDNLSILRFLFNYGLLINILPILAGLSSLLEFFFFSYEIF